MASTAALELVIGLKDQASSGLGKISDALGSIGRLAGGVALGGVVALGGGLAAAVGSGLSFNNTLEQTTAKMIAFTGSQEEAGKVLDMVRSRAAKTPFAFNEMADAAAAFLPLSKQTGVALEEYISQAEVLAALNPAEGLAGAAFALREAAGGDFLSIIERFNLPKQRLMELKAQGVPALEAVKTALAEMGVDASLVAGLGETMSGRWSTFQDTLQGLAATATSGLFDGMKDSLVGVQSVLDANSESLNAMAAAIGERLGAALQGTITFITGTVIPGFVLLRDVWGDFADGFSEGGIVGGLSALIDRLTAIFPILAPINTLVQQFADAWFQAGGAAEMFAPQIQMVQEVVALVLATMQERFNALLGVVQSVLPTIQSIVMSVFGIISGFLQEHGASILTTLMGAWTTVQGAITQAITIVGSVVQTGLQVVAAFLQQHGAEIQSVLGMAWQTIQLAIEVVMAAIQNVIMPTLAAIAGFINSHSEEILAVLSGAWNLIHAAIQTALNLIQGVLRTALALLKGDWEGAWNEVKTTATTLWNDIKNVVEVAINNVKTTIDTVLPLIQSAVETVWNTIKSTAETAWESIRSTVETKIGEVLAIVQALPGQITGALSGLAADLVAVGADMIQGLIDGIRSIDVGSVLGGIVSGAVDAAKAAVGIKSPSKVTRDQIGKPLGEGIVVGIESTATKIKSVLGKTITDAIPFAGKLGGDLGKVVAESFKTGVDRGLEDTKNLKQIFGGKLAAAIELADDQVKQIFGGKLRAALEPEMDAVGEYLARVMIAGFNRVVADFQFGGQGDHIFVPGPGHVAPSAGKGDRTVTASSNSSYTIMVDARGASDPAAIEAAGYRGAQRALREVDVVGELRSGGR